MKIVFLVNMRSNKIGGLFLATYERVKRLQEHLDVLAIINNSAYDSAFVGLLKILTGNKRLILYRKPEIEQYKGISILNQNYRRSVVYYVTRILLPGRSETAEARHINHKYKTQLDACDLIHAHWGWPNGYYAHLIGKCVDKKYCITFHGSDINRVGKKNLPYLLTAMQAAVACFFVSSQLMNDAQKYGYSGKNGHVSYNGVDTSLFDPSLYPVRDPDMKLLGYVGALREVKGVRLLPEIFAQVKARCNQTVGFIVIGDGELKEWLEVECKKLCLNIEFTGAISPMEIPERLSHMDVLVLPSYQEGLGMVVLEANAMGIPAIGTMTGGIPEAIGFKENIFEIDKHLINNMADRAAQLLSGTANCELYRQRVIEKFSWNETVRMEMEVYKKL